jgi:hypothetical protein
LDFEERDLGRSSTREMDRSEFMLPNRSLRREEERGRSYDLRPLEVCSRNVLMSVTGVSGLVQIGAWETDADEYRACTRRGGLSPLVTSEWRGGSPSW